jgi:hypothetical protein
VTASATIVAHLEGDREEAAACLGALAALSPVPEHEIIVIDDAAVGLGDLLDDVPAGVQILRNKYREGFVASAVGAASRAASDVMVLLCGAPELEPSALGPLVAGLSDPGLAAVAASLPMRPDSHPACSHALAVRREDVSGLARAVGILPGYELAAMCMELAASGRRAITAPDSVARPPRPRASVARATLGELPALTVVVPTLDATSDRVRACVAAVQARTEVPHQIVLVDNGAPPQGFTAPVNSGLRAAETPYAVVMNDDVEPQAGWWPPLKEALDNGASVAFPLTEGSWFRTDFSAWCFALNRKTSDDMAHAPGEFFDPRFRVWYQDTDLLTRLRAIGRPPELVRDSRIRHGLSQTVESEDPELRAWVEHTIREDRAAFELKHPSVVVHADG